MVSAKPITPRSTLDRQIRRGISWNAANLVLTKGISIGVRLLLARLLVPEHFGLIAMVVIVIGLINIFVDFGLKNALIQRKRDAHSLIRYDSAFWLLLASGIAWMLLFIIAGIPLMIWLYDEPQLRDLALVMSVSILLQSLSILPTVRLTRRMRFKQQAIAELISIMVASAVAVALAFAGFGVWALAAQQIVNMASKTLMLWHAAWYRPRWRFDWGTLKDVAGFSGWMLGNQIVYFSRQNADKFVIGALLGAHALGVYTMAHMIAGVLRQQLSTIINRVMLPAYSKNQDSLAQVKSHYLAVVKANSILVVPPAVMLFLYSDPLVPALLGKEWSGAVGPTKILAVAVAIYAIGGAPANVLTGLGLVKSVWWISLLNFLLILLPLLTVGSMVFGLAGAAGAVAIHYLTLRFSYHWSLRKVLGLRESEIVYQTKWPLSICMLCIVQYWELAPIGVGLSIALNISVTGLAMILVALHEFGRRR